ncbi:hypothetical protein [Modicisalibacter sp. 'Wilcox']|uniref:hypothetical protein n=1 Tax=Modicisalibacter sp. 'Wilcox' TaxID=2679914 RepID=UPI0013D210FA|nr:hypothetical protein [Modicisalibacter sp. 'Wilcox']
MPGLLSRGAAPAPQRSARPQQAAPAPQAQSGQPNDPRTDQHPDQGRQQYEHLTQAMLNYLYGPGLDQVHAALSHGDNATQRMAVVISSVLLTIQQSLAAQGKTVPPGVMFQAAMELAKAVGEIAVEMGRLPKEGSGDAIETAFMAGVGRFGQLVSDSAMTREQRQRYADLIKTMKALKQQAGPRETQEPRRQEQDEPMGQEAREAPMPRQPMQGGM